jgi:flavorubredoxin
MAGAGEVVHRRLMETRIDPIVADHIWRISTYVPEGPPGGVTFNQFVLVADEPLLVHTGMRRQFAAVRDAVASIVPLERLRWISSCHASRPDEYGSLAEWMDVAPDSVVAHGHAGCFLCLDDVSPRPPHGLADGACLDLGGLEVQWFDTPHVPGPWEAGVLFERTTRTLFCGDLFATTGRVPVTTADDIVEPAIAHDQLMHGHAITPNTGPTLRRLAELEPARLALMHGPTFVGDGAEALRRLAGYFDACLLVTT